jgi:hypothetical protein
MPDSQKITIKTKVTINTISDDVDARDNAARHQRNPHSSSNRSSLNDDEGQYGENRRHSSKRQSRGRKVSNVENVESINLQQSNKQRPVELKASFLRRKMKEYEGNKLFPSCYKLFTLQVCLSSLSHSFS